jgi:hypothetical protein
MPMANRLLLPLLAACLLWHCGGVAPSAAGVRRGFDAPAATAGTGPAPEDRLIERAERFWRQRQQEGSLRQAIESWEEALARDGENASVRIRLARAYHLLARTGLSSRPEDRTCDTPERAETRQMLARGVESAEKALDSLAPGLVERLLDLDATGSDLPELGDQTLAALFWRAVNLREWTSSQGFGEAVARQQEIRVAMTVCLRQSPGFHNAGPHRYFGSHLALPLFRGDRDLKRSREHFERALSLAPDFLENRLAYATTYAVSAQDYRTFEEQLGRVLLASPDASAEMAAENRLQQIEAEVWLRRASELFE